MDIATWAWEYFGKSKIIVSQHSLPLHQEIQLEIALSQEEGIYSFCTETPSSLGLKSSEMDRKKEEMCSLVKWVQISDCFWENQTLASTCQRLKRPSRLFPNKKGKNQPLWKYGGAPVPTPCVIYIYVKVPLMQRLMLEFWRDICCCQDNDFSQELHVYFSRTIPGLILYKLQQCGFGGIECVCLTGLPAVQICLLLKMYGASWRGESNNGEHGLLSSLFSPRMGKTSIYKTATSDIFSSQMITKWN